MMTADVASQVLLDHLQEGKVVQLVPQGISMLPFIRGGRDKVLIQRKDGVKLGDIVLVKYGANWILHRVYAIDGTHLTLMGDGNLVGFEHVETSEVAGTVVGIIRPDGRCCKPHSAWLWRHTRFMRRIMLKVHRKWNKWLNKQ